MGVNLAADSGTCATRRAGAIWAARDPGRRLMPALLRHLLAAAPLLAALAGTARAEAVPGAVYVVTYIDVQAKAAGDGARLVKRYRAASRGETGNLWLAIGQEVGRPNRFVIVEGWRDQAAFDGHDKADPAARLRQALAAIQHSPADRRINHGFAVGDDPPGGGAIYVETHIDVMPPRREAAEAALATMAEDTRKDAGSVSYDVFQQNPPTLNHFNVFAVWRSRGALEAHEMAAHRAQFRETLAPMLGALYDERLYKPLD